MVGIVGFPIAPTQRYLPIIAILMILALFFHGIVLNFVLRVCIAFCLLWLSIVYSFYFWIEINTYLNKHRFKCFEGPNIFSSNMVSTYFMTIYVHPLFLNWQRLETMFVYFYPPHDIKILYLEYSLGTHKVNSTRIHCVHLPVRPSHGLKRKRSQYLG